MSFSQDAKIEITKKKIAKPCCVRAACYAVACFGKYFDRHGVVLQTETPEIAALAQKLYSRSGIKGTVIEKERQNGCIYEFSVKEEKEVAKLLELLRYSDSEASLRIDSELLACRDCLRTFISVAFLCGGTITDPSKTYQLEFVTGRYNLARDFEALLAELEFRPGRAQRKGTNVIYIKSSESIQDLLAYMGASGAAMEILNSKIFKDYRNKSNRISNCETANIGKTVKAAVQVQKAIQYLKEQDALKDLPEPLREAAKKRTAHPDYTLAQLAETFDPPISKSGLSHRLKKLVQLAEDAQKRSSNG